MALRQEEESRNTTSGATMNGAPLKAFIATLMLSLAFVLSPAPLRAQLNQTFEQNCYPDGEANMAMIRIRSSLVEQTFSDPYAFQWYTIDDPVQASEAALLLQRHLPRDLVDPDMTTRLFFISLEEFTPHYAFLYGHIDHVCGFQWPFILSSDLARLTIGRVLEVQEQQEMQSQRVPQSPTMRPGDPLPNMSDADRDSFRDAIEFFRQFQ